MTTPLSRTTIVKSVSLPADLWPEIGERMSELRIRSFSRYIQDLILADLKARGALAIPETPRENGKSKPSKPVSYPSPRIESSHMEDIAAPSQKKRKAA